MMLSKYVVMRKRLTRQQIASFSSQSKKAQILDRELSTNPYFDLAYERFQKAKEPTTLNREQKNLDFINSLKLRYKTLHTDNADTLQAKNFKNFVEGYKSPAGPLSYMSEEEKLKINIQIDQKMDELEATGLSREEILYDDGKRGVPLAIDPFFQFLRKNYLAREMFLGQAQEYDVQVVLEIALRQDIGVDPSQAQCQSNITNTNKLDREFKDLDEYQDKNKFDVRGYYANQFEAKDYHGEIISNFC